MASSSSIRLIYRRGFAGSSWISGKWAAGSCSHSSPWFKSPNSFYGRGGCQWAAGSMSGCLRFYCSSPWLMLPPFNSMSYKFYSLAENKVLTVSGSGKKEELTDDLKFRGSSHGWLALFNPHNFDLFLYNPLSRRHLKLPSIQNLPNFPNDDVSLRSVAKVILSSSPDEDEKNCRAVIIYNCIYALAFCCPGRSTEWTPIGDLYRWDEDRGKRYARSYEDCVYSTRQKAFFGLANSGDLESWDLRDPSSPRVIKMMKVDDDKYLNFSTDDKEELQPKDLCRAVEHLVVAEQDLFMVTRYVMEHVGLDGSYVDTFDEGSQNCPHMTVDFDIYKYDPEEGDLKYVDSSSLGGLAFFIGFHSHSIALPAATQFPELKPNSIYFTDPLETGTLVDYDDGKPFGGHDIGIFNYEDKTVSPCYYSCDVQSLKKIVPSPMWFFPSRPI